MAAESDLTLAAEILTESPGAAPGSPADAERAGGMPQPFGFSWRGRIGRLRCLAYALASVLPLVAGLLIGGLVGGLDVPGELAMAPLMLGAWATVWLALRAMILRLHDLGRSGRWAVALIGLCVLAGLGVSLAAAKLLFALLTAAFAAVPGSPKRNRYGPRAGSNGVWTAVAGGFAVVLALLVTASDLHDPWAGGPLDDAALAAEQQRLHQELQQQLEELRSRAGSDR